MSAQLRDLLRTGALTDLLWDAKHHNRAVVLTLVDLANAFGSVGHNIIDHALKIKVKANCHSHPNRESDYPDFSSDIDLKSELTINTKGLEECKIWRVRLFSNEINRADTKIVADAVLFDPSQ